MLHNPALYIFDINLLFTTGVRLYMVCISNDPFSSNIPAELYVCMYAANIPAATVFHTRLQHMLL